MKQHPIPQNIASYQFRLVGDMTLKQFLYLAGGIIVAVIIYYSPTILPFIKWPLIIFSIFLGIALAFFPIEERPLDVWIAAFFKSIYLPTQYVWKKIGFLPPLFKLSPVLKTPSLEKSASSAGRVSIQDYLKTLPSSVADFEEPENQRLKQILKLLQMVDQPKGTTIPVSASMAHTIPPAPTTKPPVETDLITAVGRFDKVQVEEKGEKPTTVFEAPIKIDESFVVIPTAKAIKIEKKEEVFSSPVEDYRKPMITNAPPFTPPLPVKTLFNKKPVLTKTTKPQFAIEVPMPQSPKIPNALVGMVTSRGGKILPNTLIEVKDQKGDTVRALKTNLLGQFFMATSLGNGVFQITPEHPGHRFDIMEIRLEGKMVPPLKIAAKEDLRGELAEQPPALKLY